MKQTVWGEVLEQYKTNKEKIKVYLKASAKDNTIMYTGTIHSFDETNVAISGRGNSVTIISRDSITSIKPEDN